MLPPNDANFSTIAGGASSAKSEYVSPDDDSVERAPLDSAPVNPGIAFGSNNYNYFDFVRGPEQSQSSCSYSIQMQSLD